MNECRSLNVTNILYAVVFDIFIVVDVVIGIDFFIGGIDFCRICCILK